MISKLVDIHSRRAQFNHLVCMYVCSVMPAVMCSN